MNKVELDTVTKIIKGRVILSNINLSIQAGEVIGFYGPNGSGKSMLLKIISGLVAPTSGQVYINGQNITNNDTVPESMGILIEQPGLINSYSAYKNLQTMVQIKCKVGNDEIKKALAQVGLSWTDKRPVSKYSLGMRQKLGIAQAIVEYPDIILLDEPTNNLDNETIKHLGDVLKQIHLSHSNTWVIVSHQINYLEELCSRIIYIQDGKIRGKQ